MKKIFILIAIMFSVVSVMGCRNTAQGVGDDVEKAGDAIKDATN